MQLQGGTGIANRGFASRKRMLWRPSQQNDPADRARLGHLEGHHVMGTTTSGPSLPASLLACLSLISAPPAHATPNRCSPQYSSPRTMNALCLPSLNAVDTLPPAFLQLHVATTYLLVSALHLELHTRRLAVVPDPRTSVDGRLPTQPAGLDIDLQRESHASRLPPVSTLWILPLRAASRTCKRGVARWIPLDFWTLSGSCITADSTSVFETALSLHNSHSKAYGTAIHPGTMNSTRLAAPSARTKPTPDATRNMQQVGTRGLEAPLFTSLLLDALPPSGLRHTGKWLLWSTPPATPSYIRKPSGQNSVQHGPRRER
ncbi:hypothetical protein IWX90DRAFT_65916 [Phyllosticta citrichinensis]|uniref:Uncharacterized protein n=1 Tax=Phyllosticta citrichinensis TaxID=1130410 RepID=A0ABR1XHN6_9PEZI